jgi:hypothetical protein
MVNPPKTGGLQPASGIINLDLTKIIGRVSTKGIGHNQTTASNHGFALSKLT